MNDHKNVCFYCQQTIVFASVVPIVLFPVVISLPVSIVMSCQHATCQVLPLGTSYAHMLLQFLLSYRRMPRIRSML